MVCIVKPKETDDPVNAFRINSEVFLRGCALLYNCSEDRSKGDKGKNEYGKSQRSDKIIYFFD